VHRRDPLSGVEQVAFAEEVSSVVRHSARNKLAAARNAGTYIQRRLSKTEEWRQEARIQQFYDLMVKELDGVGELLDPRESMDHFFTRRIERVAADGCIRQAVDTARADDPSRDVVRADAREGHVSADARELSLGIRCLVENAIEAGAGVVEVSGELAEDRYVIEVSDDGSGIPESSRELALTPFFTTKADHAGLGLGVARRIARRYGGELSLGTSRLGGLSAILKLPASHEGGT
jgi:signal transduction histidine kinase